MKVKSRPSKQYFQENREAIDTKIREYREKKGLNLKGLTLIMEVNNSIISKVETDNIGIIIDYQVESASYLDFNISALEKLGK